MGLVITVWDRHVSLGNSSPARIAGGLLKPRSSGLQHAMQIRCPHQVRHQYGDLPGAGDHQVA